MHIPHVSVPVVLSRPFLTRYIASFHFTVPPLVVFFSMQRSFVSCKICFQVESLDRLADVTWKSAVVCLSVVVDEIPTSRENAGAVLYVAGKRCFDYWDCCGQIVFELRIECAGVLNETRVVEIWGRVFPRQLEQAWIDVSTIVVSRGGSFAE